MMGMDATEDITMSLVARKRQVCNRKGCCTAINGNVGVDPCLNICRTYYLNTNCKQTLLHIFSYLSIGLYHNSNMSMMPCYRVKPCSVYGGYGTRVSSCGSESLFGSSCQFYYENCFLHREKALMQNLNDRLASYLGNFGSLERKNSELEKKIEEWCTSHTVESHDYSQHLTTIKSLEDQVTSEQRDHRDMVVTI